MTDCLPASIRRRFRLERRAERPGLTVRSFLAGVFLSGCAAAARPSDVVVYASGADLESANPLVTIHPLAMQVQRHMLFVTLVRYDSALVPQPYFAHSWTWGTDRRSLTMRLDPELRWHDGTATTARDVAFTFNAARDPRGGYARAADLADVRAVEAPANTIVVFRFRRPQRSMPRILAELPIVPRHKITSPVSADMRRADFNFHPVGNGPFRFVSRLPGQHWTFERNSDFPATMGGPPRVRQIVIAVVDEATTKFAGLASGDLDFAGISGTMAHLAERDPVIEVMQYPVLFSTGLIFNVHRPPFDDARVRQAVSLSIDRKRIVDAALAGYGTPSAAAAPPENPLALAVPPSRDPARADSLLDAAGWRRGDGGWRVRGSPFRVELMTVGAANSALEQLVQADLAERGIRVDIRQLEMATFLQRARATPKDFDILVAGVPGDLSLAYLRAMFQSSQTGGSLDYAGFHSPTLDHLFTRVGAAQTDGELVAAWHGVQRELARQVPVAWLYHSRGLQGVSSRMRNVVMDLRGELATVTQWTIAP